MTKETTDIKILKKYPERFTWGKCIKIYSVGPYDILVYHPYEKNTVDIMQTNFHCWVCGYDTNATTNSFDSALAHCIAYKHEGPDTRADNYFMKMLRED